MRVEPIDIGDGAIVDMKTFEGVRQLLGAGLIRTLGYFAEDGRKAVSEIEDAQRAGDAARMVMPAHTLKTEARQFGAVPLGELAYQIEMRARRCVEIQERPDELLVAVSKLRPLFEQTLEIFERETNPLKTRTARS